MSHFPYCHSVYLYLYSLDSRQSHLVYHKMTSYIYAKPQVIHYMHLVQIQVGWHVLLHMHLRQTQSCWSLCFTALQCASPAHREHLTGSSGLILRQHGVSVHMPFAVLPAPHLHSFQVNLLPIPCSLDLSTSYIYYVPVYWKPWAPTLICLPYIFLQRKYTHRPTLSMERQEAYTSTVELRAIFVLAVL